MGFVLGPGAPARSSTWPACCGDVGSIWDRPPLGAILFAWRSWYEPVLIAVILGWAIGHLRRPVDRLVVGVLAGTYLVRSLSRMFVFDGAAFFDDDALHNPFSIASNEDLWHQVEDATLIVSAVVGVALAITCLVRRRRASGTARRTLTPVLAAGIAMVSLLGWDRVHVAVLQARAARWDPRLLDNDGPARLRSDRHPRGDRPAPERAPRSRSCSSRSTAAFPSGGWRQCSRRRSATRPCVSRFLARDTGEPVDAAGQPVEAQ